MLRSFNKHFNETVFRGPENEGGADDTITVGTENDAVFVGDGDPADTSDEAPGDTGEPEKPLSVREQIKKSMAETSEDDKAVKPKRGKDGRFGDRPAKAADAAAVQADPAAPAAPLVAGPPAPESLSKEAKAEWDKAPPAIKAAFIKREEDTARGVAELKQRYDLIDQAIAPHQDALRQMNATPGEAVNRMFLWFKALANSPVQSVPALIKSMGMDWDKLASAISGAAQQQPGQTQQTTQTGAPEIPEPVKQYIGTLEQQLNQFKSQMGQFDQRFNTVQQDLNASNEAKTRENLSIWSKEKEFFEEVRQDMAQLIQTGMVPLKNGQVDLDTAYERAIYYNPDVRAKVLAKQQQANQQVQQQTKDAATTAQQGQVAKARKASVSLPAGGAPGAPSAAGVKKPAAKTSVRDSLKAAMAELRDQ